MHFLSRVLCLSALCSVSLVSCAAPGGSPPNDSRWSGVADEDDPRSVGARAVLAAYFANDPAAMSEWLADDAKIKFNKDTADKATFLANVSKDHELFSDIKPRGQIVTTLRYNCDVDFTNIWVAWTGKLRETGQEVEVPLYMFMSWEDGKVVGINHLFDPGPIDEALESIGVEPY